MDRLHIHLPERIHLHRPDWHALMAHLKDMTHDRRFWAALALVVLFGLMILTAILTKTPAVPRSGPIAPFTPYWP